MKLSWASAEGMEFKGLITLSSLPWTPTNKGIAKAGFITIQTSWHLQLMLRLCQQHQMIIYQSTGTRHLNQFRLLLSLRKWPLSNRHLRPRISNTMNWESLTRPNSQSATLRSLTYKTSSLAKLPTSSSEKRKWASASSLWWWLWLPFASFSLWLMLEPLQLR